MRFQTPHTLYQIEVAKTFQKGATLRPFKQLNLEQDPGHNIR